MRYSSTIFTILLLTVLFALLIVTGIKMRPGIGIITAIITIPIVMWLRGSTPSDIGLGLSVNWTSTVIKGLGFGVAIVLASIILIEPIVELLTHTPHDYESILKLRGNKIALMQILFFVWVFVALVEEVIFRGFFITELYRIIGTSWLASTFVVILTSVVFGLCHAYQNTSGVVTTGITGVLFSLVFLLSGRNLWVVVLAHGTIDTIGILAIYFGFDTFLRQLFWK